MAPVAPPPPRPEPRPILRPLGHAEQVAAEAAVMLQRSGLAWSHPIAVELRRLYREGIK